MPPGLPIALLACARIGAIQHRSGFSAGLRPHSGYGATVLITPTPATTARSSPEDAGSLASCPPSRRSSLQPDQHQGRQKAGRDFWWHEEMAQDIKRNASEMWMRRILSCHASAHRNPNSPHPGRIHPLRMAPMDLHWMKIFSGAPPTSAGHRAQLHRLASGRATSLMFEVQLSQARRFWDREVQGQHLLHGAHRSAAMMRDGTNGPWVEPLPRLLGFVRAPSTPKPDGTTRSSEKCPIVDTWWQTRNRELITPAGAWPSARFGHQALRVDAAVIREDGRPVPMKRP
jgi:acyl-coenzyme A synthetase/AMP-(fatty) acid ligase